MPWLSADIVFDGYDFYHSLYLLVDEWGKIIQRQEEKPSEEVEHLNGLLMPGMVNAHCHLELSHYENKLSRDTGLPVFLQNVNELNKTILNNEEKELAMEKADQTMLANGIVAVGDICNTVNSINVKQKSKIRYHNFIECITIRATDVARRFSEYKIVYDAFVNNHFSTSYALHAPYTCHKNLYKLVNEQSNFITIHNQESAAERLLFQNEAGPFDDFYKHFGLDKKEIVDGHTLPSSFLNSMRLLDARSKKLFVHNTFTLVHEIAAADENTYWCFCPKANLYIENVLPNIELFLSKQNNIVLGTDSLASNNSLSILDEVKTIQDNFPKTSLRVLLQWATINGAKFFGLDNQIGDFAIGKSPAFVNVVDIDIEKLKLNSSKCLVLGFK